ncbi:NAC domain-containing protein 45-like [Panicum miliaceum]|uniref:NAC domain-containing protein 45-like n=1 Tax=Panicum miliaceum TaxID=4540 RepID=A0A3L6SLB1_PANMI|nr:NAC domain-containing protein 45-like [Panicum miliaceum]
MAGSPPRAPPATFASHPSFPELIDSYLRPRLDYGEKPGEFIQEADAYAAGPDQLTGQFPPATARDGEQAWYFFTRLKLKGGQRRGINRAVDTGEGRWSQQGGAHEVRSNIIGDHPQRENFVFVRKEDDKLVPSVRTRWSMVELRRDRSDMRALCKVYRCVIDPKAKADDGNPGAATAGERGGKEAEDEASAAAGVAAPGREEEDDEEIVAETTAGSPGRQKKAVGASAGAEKAKAPAEGEDVSAMSGSLQKFPPAPFASHPSDAELVYSYLRPSVVSGEKMGEFIHEADIYAARPNRLTTDLTLNSGATAASTGRQESVSESAGAATTLELFPGLGASPDAAEEAETPAEAAEEPEDPSKPRLHNFF